MRRLLLPPLLLAAVALVLAAPGAQATTLVDADVVTDTLWRASESPYIVTRSIRVMGADGGDAVTTLTIEPGVEVRFQPWTGLTIATASGAPGALVASGTAAEPIVFTSNASAKRAGDWFGIRFEQQTRDDLSVLANASASFGGASGNVQQIGTSVPMRDVTLAHASGTGAVLRDSQANLERLVVERNGGVGLELERFDGNLYASAVRDNAGHGVIHTGGDPVVSENTFSRNGGYGFYASLGAPQVLNNVFSQNAQRPLRIHVDSRSEGNQFTGNAIQEIELTGASVTVDTTWNLVLDAGTGSQVVRVVLDSVTIQGRSGADGVTTLAIEPGVEVRFARSRGLSVASATEPGALAAEGTPQARIVFTSAQPSRSPGDWSGIRFFDMADDDLSKLEHATVEHAGAPAVISIHRASPRLSHVVVQHGSSHGILVEQSDVRIDNSTLARNAGHGLLAHQYDGTVEDSTIQQNGQYGAHITHGSPVLRDITYHANHQRPLRAPVTASITGASFHGNVIQEVELGGGVISTRVSWAPFLDSMTGEQLPRVVLQPLSVGGARGGNRDAALTISPGVEVRFAQGALLQVGGSGQGGHAALDAVGTAASPILLTSRAPLKAPGQWSGVLVDAGSDPMRTRLENLTIEYAAGPASLELRQVDVQLKNVVARHGSADGLLVRGGSPILHSVTAEGNAGHGVHAADGARFQLVDVRLEKNGAYGVYTAPGSVADIRGALLSGNQQRPLRMDVDAVLENATFKDNVIAEIELVGATVSRDRTLSRHQDASTGSPLAYVVTQTIAVAGRDGADGSTTLTVGPGVELRFSAGAGLRVGTSQPGAIVAQGTATFPVLLTSNQPVGFRAPGSWEGLTLGPDARQAVLENVTLLYAGAGGHHAMAVHGPALTLRNSAIRHATGAGIGGTAGPGSLLDGNNLSDVATGLALSGERLDVRNNAVDARAGAASLQDLTSSTFESNRFASGTGSFNVSASASGNSFVDNRFSRALGAPVVDDGQNNRWNATPTRGSNILGGAFVAGNSYSDHRGVDASQPPDGLGDAPYVLAGAAAAVDHHPLVAEQGQPTPSMPADDATSERDARAQPDGPVRRETAPRQTPVGFPWSLVALAAAAHAALAWRKA